MRTILSTIMALFLVVSAASLPAQADQAANSKWNQLAWSDMKPSDHASWQVLGWSKEAWDSGNSSLAPASENKSWAELTVKEQKAAEKLGYNETCWDGS